MKGVQCYELFGGIALKNHAFFLNKTFFEIIIHNLKRQSISNVSWKPVIHNKNRKKHIIQIMYANYTRYSMLQTFFSPGI